MDNIEYNGNKNINDINNANICNNNEEKLDQVNGQVCDEQKETVDYGFILVDGDSSNNAVLAENSDTEPIVNQYQNDERYQTGYYNAENNSASFQVNGKRKTKKGNGWVKTVAVASVSSIVGGILVGAFILFALPKIQPSFKEYLSQKSTSGTVTSDTQKSQDKGTSSSAYTKVDFTEEAGTIVTKVAKEVGPSVVGIMVTPGQRQYRSYYDLFSIDDSSPSQGSGIIIREDGYIVTNFHVIEDAYDDNTGKFIKNSKIEVYLPGESDTPYEAEVIGKDSKTDLAVIKIDKTGLPAVTFADSDKTQVGELAIAIGNPGGLEFMGSVTVGFISGLNRTVTTEDGKTLTYLQTDAAINPGNSGGALVNSNGEVMGINTVKITAQGFEGIGFAIPSNKVKEITNSLIQYKYVKGRPLLGIVAESDYTSEVAKYYGWPEGVYVADVTTFSGAYMAGIKQNDIITKFDGTEIKSFDELKAAIEKHKPGDVVKVEIYRNGKTMTLDVTLSEDKG